MAFINLVGQVFGYLTVLRRVFIDGDSHIFFMCRCICGVEKVIGSQNLRNGTTRSCGDTNNCEGAFILASSRNSNHGLSDTIEYICWNNIKERCYSMLCEMYNYYGARGIIMFEAWINDFQAFYDYIQTLPETREQFEARTGKKATIERINVNGNYEPGNLCWITQQEQCQNRRSNVLNKEMVIVIKTEIKNGNSKSKIYELLKINYNYKGSYEPIRDVILGKTWNNIKI